MIHVTEGGRAVAGAEVLVWSILEPSRLVRVAEGIADARGETTLTSLPPDTFLLLATGPNGHRARATLRLSDSAPEPVTIALEPARTLTVRVADADDRPVPGAVVELSALRPDTGDSDAVVDYDPAPSIAPTDGEGKTTIGGLCANERLWVGASADGFVPFAGQEATGPPQNELVRLSLTKARTVSWPLVAGERPPPASGTVVTLTTWPGVHGRTVPETARIEGTRLIVDGLPDDVVHAIATAPDGSIAELHGQRDVSEPPATSFLRPRRIDVTVTDPEGRGVGGVDLLPRCRWPSDTEWRPARRTNESGHAVFEGLPAREFRVMAFVSDWGYGGTDTPDVDLAHGDARIEVRTGETHDIELHLRLNGEARLPPGLACDVAEAQTLRFDEDPVAGIVRMHVRAWHPSPDASLTVHGTRLLPAVASFSWPSDGAPAVVAVDLIRSGSVVAHVSRRSGIDLAVTLEKREDREDDGTVWALLAAEPGNADIAHPFRFEDLHPGEYRLHELTTGLVSAPFTVSAGGGPIDVALDLSTAYVVSGRVQVPDGYDVHAARVLAEGASVEMASGEHGVGQWVGDESGTFRLCLPGGRPITLHAVHPELVAPRDGGTVTLLGPRDDVVLRLAEGPRARLRLSAPPGMSLDLANRYDRTIGQVELVGDGPSRIPLEWLNLDETPDGFRFAGFVPGTYTVVLDVAPFAPKMLRDVKLGDGVTDLGEVSLERGSFLTLKLLTSAGKPAPAVRVRADPRPAGSYVRFSGGVDDALRVRGLGAGRFDVEVTWTAADGEYHVVHKNVEVDGQNDVTLDVDVR